jgi:hypothetical protein
MIFPLAGRSTPFQASGVGDELGELSRLGTCWNSDFYSKDQRLDDHPTRRFASAPCKGEAKTSSLAWREKSSPLIARLRCVTP